MKTLFTFLVTALAMTAPCDAQTTLRVAHYNVSLYGEQSGEVAQRLATGTDEQGHRLARIIQSVRPDVLLLCEVDYDADGRTLNEFADRYLAIDHEAKGLHYPHRWSIPSNTGVLAPADLNNDGQLAIPGDAWGYGVYPGQYAMAVLSRFPIDRDAIRTFQKYRWTEFPGALRPPATDGDTTTENFHSDAIWEQLRLSSKNHVDVPIAVCGLRSPQRIHLLASHPTPPVFDGPEDLNGRRNHDEIQFWNNYISDGDNGHLVDDYGASGGLTAGVSFVIAGDLNADPESGDGRREAIVALLQHPRTHNVPPKGTANGTSTALFGSNKVRVDYVLPSTDLDLKGSGVVWPADDQPLADAVTATDHRLVWIEIQTTCD